jgi:hypothetical protein
VVTDGQPQSPSVHLTRQACVDAVEVLEDAFQVLLGNAQPEVTDTDFQLRWRGDTLSNELSQALFIPTAVHMRKMGSRCTGFSGNG